MQDSGKPGDSSGGAAGGVKIRGNPEIHLDGTAEGCEIRGNSKIHRRRSRKMQASGKPEDSSEALLEEWRFGATRRFISQHRRRMRDSRKLEDPSPAQPGDAGSEETCGLIARLTGRCMIQATYEFILLRRQRLRSLAPS
jgi:hypothetical protein